MARSPKRPAKGAKKPIEQYEHRDKERVNNPPVGLVTPETDPDAGKKAYAYDPHLDPQLVWAGKAEHTSFEVPTVSLHVHERIDPKSILAAVRKRNGEPRRQPSLFEAPQENPPLRDALDFYKHSHGWSNRLIAGDSLLVMNSLLEKEGMAGKVQMVYIDPPYGIRYGSNFQPFVNRRDVRDGKDDHLTQEPEMIRAFRDTWELAIHSYLTYLRDRLLLARELLHESGSVIVQIGDENAHRVRDLLDEVFGTDNAVATVTFKKTSVAGSFMGGTKVLATTSDYLLWYARAKTSVKYRQVFLGKEIGGAGGGAYNSVQEPSGERRPATREELETGTTAGRFFHASPLTSETVREAQTTVFDVPFEGGVFRPRKGGWKTNPSGMHNLLLAKRLIVAGESLRYVRFLDDFPAFPLTNLWTDTQSGSGMDKMYVVQTNQKVIERCLLMATDPGDLVLDPTCGSGTTAFVAEQWGRRWITCDTSRVAITLAKQRLMTTVYDYYDLAQPEQGIGSGFRYRTVPHVTLKSIANNPELREGMARVEIDAAIAKYADQETLYDQPNVDKSKARVSGPFTVEAVPAPAVRPLAEGVAEAAEADTSEARSGDTLRHGEWRDELLKTGIRGKSGQMIQFSRVEPLAGARWLHAEAETRPNEAGAEHVGREAKEPGPARSAQRVVISFGPEHAPLEQRQVELAWHEARQLSPKPAILVFAAFQFDPEAAKDIDDLSPLKAGVILPEILVTESA